VVAALAGARREVQRELETSTDMRDNLLAVLGEWAVVTVLAASPTVAAVGPRATDAGPRQLDPPRIKGMAARAEWYFVGRRPEQRSWPTELTESALAGLVVHGIGGTGKTTLAAELAARIHGREPGRVLVSLAGPLTLEGVLGELISVVRRELLVGGQDKGDPMRALDLAARADLGWADRWSVLRDHVLGRVRVLVVLDNFEDNLRPEGDAGYTVRDEVLAGLLAAWVADPGASRLLVTCRYRFTLPDGAEQYLSFRQLGALSRAETMKLAWSLPALNKLDESQLERVWRLAGGHPRSLEYLDALLSGGTARYPDVTTQLNKAVSRRLCGTDKDRWLAARSALDAALAETVALAADDVLLDDLLTRLGQVPGAAELLVGVSVYREPVDTNAVLFQAGLPDPAAEDLPDRKAARERISEILAAAGITVHDSIDPASLPEQVQAQLAPHIEELSRAPVPPQRSVPDLAERLEMCQAASLLTISGTDQRRRFFVHRWTATELADRATATGGPGLGQAHRQAAAYWRWRVRAWPQDRAANVHDLLEARHHLLAAGDTEAAGQVTEWICTQLQTWGAWDQEASLIHDTLSRLPADSPRQAAWIQELGILAQNRGDYDEATRQYQRSLAIEERLGNQAGMALSYGQLGILAENRGDYDEATRQYQRALDIFERLGDQTHIATTYHQLGILAQNRGDYDEATRQLQRALAIKERLGDQTGMALSYGQLGNLAHLHGDHDEATRQYQRALDIFERLGNQTGMATSYYQLGMLASRRGDYDEATRQYQRALDIFERLGNQARMASTYHQLGILAQNRGDYDEATRQLQRALAIKERVGNQVSMAITYSQLGVLEAKRGGPETAAIAWHMKALAIRLRLGIPQAVDDLRRLATYRSELGPERFTSLLTQATSDTGLAEAIASQLGQLDAADSNTADTGKASQGG
jgi:tetratricopeptide (TPR) repeat protein